MFDTERRAFLDDELPIAGCIGGLLVPRDSSLGIACPHAGTYLSAPISADGSFGPLSSVQASAQGIVGAARLPGASDVLLLTKASKIVQLSQAGSSVLLALDVDSQTAPVLAAFAVSPDGSKAFVGVGDASADRITTVQLYDLQRRIRTASRDLPSGAWTMTLAPDGNTLFLPSPKTNEVFVLDADDLQLIRRLPTSDQPFLVVR